jgi:hypothetical protein
LKPWLLVRVWEIQKRGLLHAHPVLAYSTPREKTSADRYLEVIDALRRQYGFGYVERKRRVREPRAAAAYLSSYFIAGKGSKISLEESVQSNWMPRSIVHVSKDLTQLSGVTMRTLRLRRYAWVLWRASDPSIWALTGLEPQDLWYGLREGVTLTELVASALDESWLPGFRLKLPGTSNPERVEREDQLGRAARSPPPKLAIRSEVFQTVSART